MFCFSFYSHSCNVQGAILAWACQRASESATEDSKDVRLAVPTERTERSSKGGCLIAQETEGGTGERSNTGNPATQLCTEGNRGNYPCWTPRSRSAMQHAEGQNEVGSLSVTSDPNSGVPPSSEPELEPLSSSLLICGLATLKSSHHLCPYQNSGFQSAPKHACSLSSVPTNRHNPQKPQTAHVSESYGSDTFSTNHLPSS